MKLFERTFSFWLVVLLLPLLFLPKINIFSVGEKETAGLRIDDIFLFFFLILIVWRHGYLGFKFNRIEKTLLFFVLCSMISYFSNRYFVWMGWLNVDANILYSLRMAEYFLFFYIGMMAYEFLSEKTVIQLFLYWNFSWMILQYFGLLGQFSHIGYKPGTDMRITGIASFPSEAGMLLNMLFAYLAFSKDIPLPGKNVFSPNIRYFLEQTYIYWLFFIFSILVILSGSRIALAALGITFLFKIKEDLKRGAWISWFFAAFFICVGSLLLVQMIYNSNAIYERSAGLISYRNIELVEQVWDRVDINNDPMSKEAVQYKNYDMSWWMRIHKWMYVLKLYVTNPECYLQGIGPGVALAAVDGGYIRLLTENGLLGLCVFMLLIKMIAKQSTALKWIVYAFMLNMIFFDVYLAYKPMSLLFLLSGFTLQKNEKIVNTLYATNHPLKANPQT